MKTVPLTKDILCSNNLPFVLIAGPCAIEGRDHTLMMAEKLCKMTQKLGIGFIYKSSFDKANRTSIQGRRGVGMEEGLRILSDVKDSFHCPIITDVHEASQCTAVSQVCDILQIPALLCRQTDLLLAAAKTMLPVNVKKGQFMAPKDMQAVVKKIETVHENILLCERGTSFGYNTLINDMRALPIMKQTGYPVIFDATHSVQQPSLDGTKTSGERQFAPILARAAISLGIAGVFMETHDNPDHALSDGPNMIPLHRMEEVLIDLKRFDALAKAHPCVDLSL